MKLVAEQYVLVFLQYFIIEERGNLPIVDVVMILRVGDSGLRVRNAETKTFVSITTYIRLLMLSFVCVQLLFLR